MKVAILGGTPGSCFAEDKPELKPKTMVEIGGKTNSLAHPGCTMHTTATKKFVIALGHKGEVIKKYMVDYCSGAQPRSERVAQNGARSG